MASNPPSAAASEPSSRPIDRCKGRSQRARRAPGSPPAHAYRRRSPRRRASPTLDRSAFRWARIHLQLIQKVENFAGIETPASGAHGQPVRSREAHRRRHAAAVVDGAHPGAVTKVSTIVLPRAAPTSSRGRTLAMCSYESPWKPYLQHTTITDRLRQRECLCDRRRAAVEGRVETRHLKERRRAPEQRPDGREIMRLMQRRQRERVVRGLPGSWHRRERAACSRARHARHGDPHRTADARRSSARRKATTCSSAPS